MNTLDEWIVWSVWFSTQGLHLLDGPTSFITFSVACCFHFIRFSSLLSLRLGRLHGNWLFQSEWMAIVCPAPKSLLLEPIVCRCVVGGKAIQNNRTAAAYLGRLCMALTGPCFVFLFGSEGVVFSVLCVHARTVVVVLKSENLILFLAKRKRETDGRPASREQMIGPVPRKRLSCAVVVFCVSSSSVVSVSPLISTIFCFS